MLLPQRGNLIMANHSFCKLASPQTVDTLL